MRNTLHNIIDWISDGCPYERPLMWLDGKLLEFFATIKRRWMKWLANELVPYMPPPPPPPTTAEVVDKRWRKAKPAKCVNTTQCSSGTVVSIPIRKEMPKTTAMHRDETVIETERLRMSLKAETTNESRKPNIQQPASKIDPETAALPNQDLADMLKALGCKPISAKPDNTYRARLLAAVEGALYKPTRKVAV